jgi:hypothetical protein
MTSTNVPNRLGYDAILAPLDLCCGVFDQLAWLDGPVPPMAQLGNMMLFLVRPGSTATATASLPTDRVTLGIELHDSATAPAAPDPHSGSWIVPPPDQGANLPPASTVIAAIRTAYAASRSPVGAT